MDPAAPLQVVRREPPAQESSFNFQFHIVVAGLRLVREQHLFKKYVKVSIKHGTLLNPSTHSRRKVKSSYSSLLVQFTVGADLMYKARNRI